MKRKLVFNLSVLSSIALLFFLLLTPLLLFKVPSGLDIKNVISAEVLKDTGDVNEFASWSPPFTLKPTITHLIPDVFIAVASNITGIKSLYVYPIFTFFFFLIIPYFILRLYSSTYGNKKSYLALIFALTIFSFFINKMYHFIIWPSLISLSLFVMSLYYLKNAKSCDMKLYILPTILFIASALTQNFYTLFYLPIIFISILEVERNYIKTFKIFLLITSFTVLVILPFAYTNLGFYLSVLHNPKTAMDSGINPSSFFSFFEYMYENTSFLFVFALFSLVYVFKAKKNLISLIYLGSLLILFLYFLNVKFFLFRVALFGFVFFPVFLLKSFHIFNEKLKIIIYSFMLLLMIITISNLLSDSITPITLNKPDILSASLNKNDFEAIAYIDHNILNTSVFGFVGPYQSSLFLNLITKKIFYNRWYPLDPSEAEEEQSQIYLNNTTQLDYIYCKEYCVEDYSNFIFKSGNTVILPTKVDLSTFRDLTSDIIQITPN